MKPSDIISKDEVVAAATLIKQYCVDDDERISCDSCVFAIPGAGYGERCGLSNLPGDWPLKMFRENAMKPWRYWGD